MNTILNRIGNKQSIAHLIIKHFPEHKTYIEMFFGAGGIFFKKPKAKYNILNDLNSNVFNLFMVLKNKPEEFRQEFKKVPINQDLFNYWKTNQETTDIMKAVRFIFLSNFGLYGGNSTFHSTLTDSNKKYFILDRIKKIYKFITNDTVILNKDFKNFIITIHWRENREKEHAFIYADPPYISTGNNYNLKWVEQDLRDLFNILINSEMRFALSEKAENKLALELANKHNLNIINICKKRSIKNRHTEILITNYENQQFNLFDY